MRARVVLLLGLSLAHAACHLVFGHDPTVPPPRDGGKDLASDRAVADARADAPADAFLGREPAREARPPDSASPDLPHGTVLPPRPLAPLSGSTTARPSPLFRWQLAGGTQGARIEVSLDRSFTTLQASEVIAGNGGALKTSLAPGKTYFWRLRGYTATTVGTSTSVIWQLRVALASVATTSTGWGNLAEISGDGRADLLIGSASGALQLYRGTATGAPILSGAINGPGSNFGRNGSATDLNGDGWIDLVTGSASQTVVYLNDKVGKFPNQHSTTWSGGMAAGVGDVNGDGYGDLVVANPDAANLKGQVSLILGGATGPGAASATFYGENADWRLGHWVDAAGDLNGDGLADFVLGTYNADAAHVCLGATPAASVSCTKISGPDPSSQFGWNLAGAGDMNGDGYADLAVGALKYGNHLGRVYVFLGSAAGVAKTPQWTLQGSIPQGAFGHSLSSAGDVNGDGYADLVVGACAYLLYSADPPQLGDRAFLFLGRPASQPPVKYELSSTVSSSQNIKFGESVAGIGDLDGDGKDEIAVSSGVKREVYLYSWDAAKLPLVRWVLSQPAIAEFGINVGRTH